MKTKSKFIAILAALCAFASTQIFAQDITLPAPQKTGGMPLMEALAKRSTARSFDATRDLTQQQVSNLLWAAFGINRADGRRTAPSAMNHQECDLYVLLRTGSYLYNPTTNTLTLVVAGDNRALGGKQDFVKDAAVTVLIVADTTRVGDNGNSPANRELSMADTGFISQNMYLYCASEGLVTGVRAQVDRDAVTKLLSLKPTQWITLAQSAGYAPAAK